jgi:glutathione synthase/RimK-type ligase-like ATP-grasp enzyme
MASSDAEFRPIALISARAARVRDADLPLLEAALLALGLDVEIVDWDDAEIHWSRFELAMIRSTWDYSARLSEFLTWLDRAALATRILNSPDVIRWNLDKHYLGELQRAGVLTVPTAYAEPGDDASKVLDRFLQEHEAAELIIKPAVGSGARDAHRYPRAAVAEMRVHLSRLLAEKRSALLQPYLERVDEQGETALIYIDGEFTHAIGKTAVLARGHAPTRSLFAPEEIVARTPADDELELGAGVLRRLPFKNLLYARVDLLRDAHGAPCVLELELAEPSLYLGYSTNAAMRLARAVAERMQMPPGVVDYSGRS